MRDPMVTRAPAAITLRDLEVLRWVGEQYAAPLSTVALLVGANASAASAARMASRTAERLERLGYAGRRPLIGQQWLAPTRRGLRAAGLPYKVDVPAEILLHHITMVGRLRLYLAATEPDATWESERAIRQRCAGVPLRRTDGGLWWPDGTATGVELERYVKRPPRYLGIVRNVDPAWTAGVWWFTPANLVPLLTQRLRDAGAAADTFEVHSLPPEVTT
jgi:hypothetical protein